jgi:hypothetical protein
MVYFLSAKIELTIGVPTFQANGKRIIIAKAVMAIALDNRLVTASVTT